MVYPEYYKKFKCIGGACRHNCCIGWEIDIDDATAEYYKTVGGELGEKMHKSIAHDGGTSHFILGDGGRCPFLNSENLCDIITELGEDKLCTICAKHPRFENKLPDRTETGIGMACEEAARLILSEVSPMRLVGGDDTDDEIIRLRDKIISLLQNRKKRINERIDDMLALANAPKINMDFAEIADLLLSLERLDEKWTKVLLSLESYTPNASFDTYMSERETEYEQLLVYCIFRHLANSPDMEEATVRAAFAALAYSVIHALGDAAWQKNGDFTFEEQVELCRLFSSEIEYSDENLYIILDTIFEKL